MTKRTPEQPPNLSDKGREAKAERDRRLAEALRANLRRRKDQARGRTEPDRDPETEK